MLVHGFNPTFPGLLVLLGNARKRENRLKELIHKAGGTWEQVHDEIIASGLTDQQYADILNQLSEEFK